VQAGFVCWTLTVALNPLPAKWPVIATVPLVTGVALTMKSPDAFTVPA